MQIKLTSFLNFRNLEDSTVNFSSGINLFYGKNGQGKTSFLEAVYFNVTGKSFRTKSQKEMQKYNFDNYGVYSEYIDMYGERNVATTLKNGKKSYFYNKKKVQFDEFMGKVNVISFIPEDINLISGSPSIRRDFFDYEISQSNFEYYKITRDFEKVLKIRNKFISEKKVKGDIFDIYNENYMDLSAKIITRRVEYIKKISIMLNLNYRKLFEKESELKIVYSSELGDLSKLKESEVKELIKKELEKNIQKELYLGYTVIGPQKDDFLFFLKEKEAKNYASMGEKRSIVFAMKIAEIDMILKEKKENPLFMIDDITSYFDKNRQESVINYFKKRNIQTFITSTEELNLGETKFYIEKGKII